MMKLLSILLALVLLGCASPSPTKYEYIRVTGSGSSHLEAKQNAFFAAVEYKVGSLVVSERETYQDKLTKEDILVYSAGFVDDYKIIRETSRDSRIILTIDVAVSDNKISQRILSKSSSTKNFNGDKHQTQIDTYIKQINDGDKILGTVLNDYPKRAFDIKQHPHELHIDHRRNVSIIVPYTMTWNYNYIVSLRAVLDKVEEGRISLFTPSFGKVVIAAKDPKDYFLGKKTIHRFNDLTRIDKIADRFAHNEVRLLMNVKHLKGNTLYCYTPKFITGYSGSFYGIGDPKTVSIYGNQIERGQLYLPVTHSIDDIYSIQLEIVSTKNC